MFMLCVWGIILIFFEMTECIISVTHPINNIIVFMMSCWPRSFWVNSIILLPDLTQFYVHIYNYYLLSCTTLYKWIFCFQLIFCKEGQLCVSLHLFKENILYIAPTRSLFLWQVFRYFKLLFLIFWSTWLSPTRE